MKRGIKTITISLMLSLSNAYAIDNTTANDQAVLNTIQRDAWFDAIEPMLAQVICKGFLENKDIKKRLDDLKITYESCMTLIPESGKICKTQIYPKMPEIINQRGAEIYGRKLGECIGKDFAEKYLIPKTEKQ